MIRMAVVCLLITVFPLTVSLAEAQQQGKIPKVGVLEPGFPPAQSPAPLICKDRFRQGLRDLGYVEGKNMLLEDRYAEFKPDRLRDLAADLVRLKPDVIWTHGNNAVLVAKQATTTIPITLGVGADLVEQGIVASLSRPGGNITGMELRDLEILGKRLEILKETVPTISHVAVLVDPTNPQHAHIPKNIEAEARTLRIQFQRVEASSPEAFDKAFATMIQGRAEALLVPEGTMFSQNRYRLLELATAKRLPTGSGGSHFAEAGSLISYGANVPDICQRSAVFVDKILKGNKPAELPVERPTKFELVINLKTAKQIGLTIPQSVLYRADRVIK